MKITEENVCIALDAVEQGLPSRHEYVHSQLLALTVDLNVANWSNQEVRASGMHRLAIARLGTHDTFDENIFAENLRRVVIAGWLPKIFRTVASVQAEPHKTTLMDAAHICEKVGDSIGVRAAIRAAIAVHDAVCRVFPRGGAAARIAEDAASGAFYAAQRTRPIAEAAGCVISPLATRMSHAIGNIDQLLSEFAEDVVQILITMETPGSEFLYLTEEEVSFVSDFLFYHCDE